MPAGAIISGDVSKTALPSAANTPAFEFPAASSADERGRVLVGGNLEPSTILGAYQTGLFPMRQGDGQLAWWSPDPRAVILPDNLRIAHSLHRAINRFEIRVDTCFEEVIDACAERAEGEYHWITSEVRAAFVEMHRVGWAHSVEAWAPAEADALPTLAGGLYGVALGRLFGGESMFHRQRDASKAALVGLVSIMREGAASETGQEPMIDCQWLTPHMASLGAVNLPRDEYLARLSGVIEQPLPKPFAR